MPPAQRLPTPRLNDGRIVAQRTGLPSHPFGDLYHYLLTTSWPKTIGLMFGAYVAINLFFGVLFLLGGDCFGREHATLFDAVMFSVQTFATIGYGVMSPTTPWAHVLVAIESFVGILAVGMGTGLMFARFSRPTSRVAFADVAVVTPRNGRPSLQIRLANERRSEILAASAEVHLVRDEETAEGQHLRRFHPLALERSSTPLFALSWTVVHPLDDGPLAGLTAENVHERLIGVSIAVQGTDDSFGSTIHARHFYRAEELVFGRRFADMLEVKPDAIHIDHRRLSDLAD